MDNSLQKIEIFGLLNDVNFHRSRCCAEDLYAKAPLAFSEPHVVGLLEFDWDIFVEEKKRELRGEMWNFTDKVMVFINSQVIGGPEEFINWAEDNFRYEDMRPDELYNILTESAYKDHLNSKQHDFVYFDFTAGEEPIGRLVIELFSDILPRTCENFKQLCSGEKGLSQTRYNLSYLGSLLHRIVPNGWIQGGDIYHSRGNGGEAIYGQAFEDENFVMKHNKRGIIGMANRGLHTNASQFYILLQPAPWMDTKYVAFGKIIEGTETLKSIEKQSCMNERPNKDIKITECGMMQFVF